MRKCFVVVNGILGLLWICFVAGCRDARSGLGSQDALPALSFPESLALKAVACERSDCFLLIPSGWNIGIGSRPQNDNVVYVLSNDGRDLYSLEFLVHPRIESVLGVLGADGNEVGEVPKTGNRIWRVKHSPEEPSDFIIELRGREHLSEEELRLAQQGTIVPFQYCYLRCKQRGEAREKQELALPIANTIQLVFRAKPKGQAEKVR